MREKNADKKKRQECQKTKFIKIQHSCSRMELPKISIEGKWLEDIGFHIGDMLQVKYTDRNICISHAPSVQPLAVNEPDTAYLAKPDDREASEDLKTKQIKVAASMRVRQNSAYAGQGFYYPERSKISMEGKWLEKAGFHAGNRIQVDYRENFICLCPAV